MAGTKIEPLTAEEVEMFKTFANRIEFQRHGNSDGSVSTKSIDPRRLWLMLDTLRANVGEPVGREELASIIHRHLTTGRGGNSVIAADAIIQKFAGRRISHD